MTDLSLARELWKKEKPVYERLAKQVEEALTEAVREKGVYARYSSRPKDTLSLLKKLIRKDVLYEELTDKAGVRAIVRFRHEVDIIAAAIDACFRVTKRDDKIEALPYNKVGYLATHFDVELLELTQNNAELQGLQCEIQVHTVCQNLWSDMAHVLSYKPVTAVPAEVNRRIHLLAAVLEVADQSFAEIQSAVQELPGMEDAELLRALEVEFFRLANQPYDQVLSQDAVSHLKELYKVEELASFSELMGAFVEQHEDRLQRLFDTYAATPESVVFLFQPEGLLILERLEKDLHALEETWLKRFPRGELEDICRAWGQPLD